MTYIELNKLAAKMGLPISVLKERLEAKDATVLKATCPKDPSKSLYIIEGTELAKLAMEHVDQSASKNIETRIPKIIER